MNERIRKIAIESGAGEWGDSVVPAMIDIEKFAKLIIEECHELFIVRGVDNLDIALEHFGVKE